MSLGGTEVVNNERYRAYAAELGLPVPMACLCPGLPVLLADSPYTAVASAPWHDPAAPESGGFAGVFCHTITGLDAATSAREVAAGPGEVGVVGPGTHTPRTIQVTMFAAATTPGALAYGLSWLDSALRDDCGGGCDGATLCMIADCPDPELTAGAAANTAWTRLTRTLHDVVVADGPKVTGYHDLAAGIGATVEFTMVAAVPFVYRAPAALGAALAFTAPPSSTDCPVQWVPVGSGRGSCNPPPPCPEPASCLTGPYAPAIPALPRIIDTSGACVTRLSSAHAIATAAPNLLPRWLDSVPVVTVTAGDADMRRLTLRFHPNPRLITITSPDDVDPCTALAEINVTYLPRDTTLVIDGRAQQAYLVCPGGVTEPADSVVFGPGGGPWDWPRLTCGAGLTVVALADAQHYSPAARVAVSLAARQDVA